LYPQHPAKAGIIIEPKYINVSALAVPAVALEQVRKEFGRMGRIALTMLSELPRAVLAKDKLHVDTIAMLDDKVDVLEAAIFGFWGKVRQQSLTAEQSKVHQDLMTATVNLETLSDVIETDRSKMAKKMIDKNQRASKTTRETFEELYKEVYRSVELAVKAIRDEDQLAARQVIKKKATFRALAEHLLARESAELGSDRAEALESARTEISFIDKLRRTYRLTRRIAKIELPVAAIMDTC
jgi:phosphate:Na+ symporter